MTLEWKNVKGLDVLVAEDGEVIAHCRLTHENLWRATYRGDAPLTYHERDQARRAMIKRHEETLKALAIEREKQDKKPKGEKKDAG